MSAISPGLSFPSTLTQPTISGSQVSPYALPSTALPSSALSLPGLSSGQDGSSSITSMLMMIMEMMMMMMQQVLGPLLGGASPEAPEAANTAPEAPSPSNGGSSGGNAGSSSAPSPSTSPSPASTSDVSGNEFMDFQQHTTPDCGVLSTIGAIASTADGKAILEKSVQSDGNGGYKVTLQGTGQTYDVSKSDMGDGGLSTGSPKVRALEVAMEKHYGENDSNFTHSAHDIMPLLTGKQSTGYYNFNHDASQVKSALLQQAGKSNTAIEVASDSLPDSPTQGFHGYTVTNVNAANNTVTYENPWDEGKAVTVNLDQFSQDVANSQDGTMDTLTL